MATDNFDEPTDKELLGDSPEEEATPDAPSEETPSEEAPAEAPADAEPARDAQIPRGRFDEVNAKLHAEREARAASDAAAAAAQAELAALKATPPPDIQALEKEYTTALMSGGEDQAAEIRGRINAELVRQATTAALSQAEERALARESTREYASTYKQICKDYPFLGAENGIEEARLEAVEWRDFYIAKGMTAAEALTKAVERIAPAYMTPLAGDNVTRLPDPRKAAAIARGAAAAKAQPASPTAGAGNRAVPVPPMPKSQEEYEALPDEERNKLLA